jgi:hypothetical protein
VLVADWRKCAPADLCTVIVLAEANCATAWVRACEAARFALPSLCTTVRMFTAWTKQLGSDRHYDGEVGFWGDNWLLQVETLDTPLHYCFHVWVYA